MHMYGDVGVSAPNGCKRFFYKPYAFHHELVDVLQDIVTFYHCC